MYVSKPTHAEKDGTTSNMFPHEARLRDLTYSSPIFVDIVSSEIEREDDTDVAHNECPKEFLGYVPIMLRSRFCVLVDKSDKELCELGECIYDQGGYFVINGKGSPTQACHPPRCHA